MHPLERVFEDEEDEKDHKGKKAAGSGDAEEAEEEEIPDCTLAPEIQVRVETSIRTFPCLLLAFPPDAAQLDVLFEVSSEFERSHIVLMHDLLG